MMRTRIKTRGLLMVAALAAAVIASSANTAYALSPVILVSNPGKGVQTWTVPFDWNQSGAKVECIGAGGDGTIDPAHGLPGPGGGGGAYASTTNFAVSAGGSVSYAIGAHATTTGGTIANETYVGSTASSTAFLSCAFGKLSAGVTAGGTGGPGGSTANSTPSAFSSTGGSYTGGTGGTALNIIGTGAGAGGGSAGKNGVGKTGGAGGPNTFSNGGGGGAGSNGGSSTNGSQPSTTRPGGNSGNGTGGTGGQTGGSGTGPSGTATTGAGGAGGGGATAANATGGGNGAVDTSFDSTHGASGGGGGGGGATGSGNRNGGNGGNGGTYGGGGGGGGGSNGGGSASNGSVGSGGQGIIFITYTPLTPGTPGSPTYSSITTTNATISWTASSAGAASSYKLETCLHGTSTCYLTTGISSPYSTTTLSANTNYDFAVVGTNESGDGSFSATTSQLTLPGTPGTPSFSNVTTSAMRVSWIKPTNGATSYNVDRCTPTGCSTYATIATGQTSTSDGGTTFFYDDSGLSSNTTYRYRVSATNSTGTGASSTAAEQTTSAGTPSTPTLSLRNNGGQVTLSWNASTGSVTGYKVYRDTSSPASTLLTTTGNVTTYNDQSITPGTTYFYRIKATGGSGDSAFSNEVNTLPTRTYFSKPPNYLSNGNGLSAYWTMDGKDTSWTSGTAATVIDRSGGGNTLTLSGMSQSQSPAPGRIGQAMKFPSGGSGTNTINLSATNVVTISFWLNGSSTNMDNIFEDSADFNGVFTGFNMFFATTDVNCPGHTNIFWVALRGDVGYNNKCYDYPGNGWHQYAAVFDKSQSGANEVTLYIDGVLKTAITQQFNSDNTNNFANDAFYLMSRAGTGSFSVGSVDDVRIYSRALSAQEVPTLYKAGRAQVNTTTLTSASQTNGLVGYWTFDGKNLQQNVTDSSGQGNNGFLVNFPATSTAVAPGKIGQALNFADNTVPRSVNVGNSTSLTAFNDFTFSAWIKLTDRTFPGNSYECILGCNNTNFFSGDYALYISGTTNSIIESLTLNASAFNDFVSVSMLLNTWYLLTVTRSGGTISYYFNGAPVLTSATTYSTQINNSGASEHIGSDNNLYPVHGDLDDVRIYNRALSAAEIQQLYNFGRAKVKP